MCAREQSRRGAGRIASSVGYACWRFASGIPGAKDGEDDMMELDHDRLLNWLAVATKTDDSGRRVVTMMTPQIIFGVLVFHKGFSKDQMKMIAKYHTINRYCLVLTKLVSRAMTLIRSREINNK